MIGEAITFGSVCSGIGAPEEAWKPLGWRSLWMAEVEAFPSAVLAYRHPDSPNLGDMTLIADMIAAGDVQAPDVLVGGTPCQSFSVAGLRKGLSDPRGGLTLSFVVLANAIDTARHLHGAPPCVVAWENVPGVLSHKHNPFGCFLGALAGEDCALEPPGGRWADAGCVFGPQRTVAWRILDAQYFLVAQRRRRVLVVASARTDFDPVAVLLEFDGLRRDSPPRREAGENPARPIAAGSGSSGGYRNDADTADNLIAGTLEASLGRSRRAGTPTAALDYDDLSPTLKARHNSNGRAAETAFVTEAFGGGNTSGPIDVAAVLNACGSASGRMDFESETFVAEVAPTLLNGGRAAGAATNQDAENGALVVQCVTGDITHTLKAEGFDASEDGTGRGNPIVPVFFQGRGSNVDVDQDVTGTLSQNCDRASGGAPCVAYRITGNDGAYETGDCVGALTTATDPTSQVVAFDVKGGLAPNGGAKGSDVAFPLKATDYKDQQVVAFSSKDYGADAEADLSPTLRAEGHDASHANAGVPPAVAFAYPINADALRGEGEARTPSPDAAGRVRLRDPGLGIGADGDPASTVTTGVPPAVAFSIMPQNSGKDYKAREVEVLQPLMAAGPAGGNQGGDYIVQSVAFALRGREGGALPEINADGDSVGALRAADGGSSRDYVAFDTTQITSASNYSQPKPGDPCHPLAAGAHPPAIAGSSVRRLTPRECERLQAFDDDYTRIPIKVLRSKPATPHFRDYPDHYDRNPDGTWTRFAADGPRYKSLGNSMCVRKMAWLGQRIDAALRGAS